MNRQQRNVMKGAMTAILLTLAFPPFVLIRGAGMTEGIGFGFILSWPELHGYQGTVDVPLLLVEWLAIGMVSAILWVLRPDADIPAIQSLLEKMNGNPEIRATILAALDKMKRE